ncbi:DMT family transporter [Sphingopyxis yananensis]|uniref:DMT family transporter n=1 Tax=Sphingopyxis yananensis TaxID=2886687 RepID=UPI001D11BCBB|nr:DMT family transporter [Sphingopyxis yananensis]
MTAFLPTALFVLLWSSGAILSEIGLRHGSAFALLLLRYAIALALLSTVAFINRRWLPDAGTRRRVMLIGFLIAGIYSSFYMLALENGVNPAAIATIMGIQPILTALWTEKHVGLWRALGLALALGGLALVVSDGLASARFEALGLLFAGIALAGITIGSIVQKQETQAPWVVLPLQYAIGLIVILIMTPFSEFQMSWHIEFITAGLWLGLIISVAATFLLYRLIATQNLVNVTSLFYLVPGVTAAMDWAILGTPMSFHAILGLALVMAGLMLVYKRSR